jgi:superfamily II DNA/RNA helicase
LESCRLANKLDIYVHLISNTNNEMKKLKEIEGKRTVILITTPNRLIHLLGTEGFDDSLKKYILIILLVSFFLCIIIINFNLRVEFLIVDEADKLFEEGQQSFRDQVNRRISYNGLRNFSKKINLI